MTEYSYNGSLEGLFSILDEVCAGSTPPGRIRRIAPAPAAGRPSAASIQGDLFSGDGCFAVAEKVASFSVPTAAVPAVSARDLYAVSADAFDAFVSAWMSELPIEAEIVRFGWKMLAAGKAAAGAAIQPAAAGETALADWTACEEARLEAEWRSLDRGDADVHAVLAAAWKVTHEIDRMRGFLRFSPAGDGVYTARCAPDHFVLPALAPHFTRRFGEQGWAIIDEKRDLCLSRRPGEAPCLFEVSSPLPVVLCINDDWGSLWRCYLRNINNESRGNPHLQRQFMPGRYWKYLPEMDAFPN